MSHLVLNNNKKKEQLYNIKHKKDKTKNFPNKRLITALEESENIVDSKIKSKIYDNFDELIEDID